jgi:hypothetical protein
MDVLNAIYCWFAKPEPAVWIALIALMTSVVVAYQNWKHNRLSVLPNIDLHRNIESSPGFVAIESSGVGPAIIERIIVRAEDKSYDLSTLSGMTTFFEQYDSLLSEYQVVEKGVFLLPGASKSILKFKSLDEARIGAFLSQLSFTIKWKSVYGKRFDTVMKNIHGA